MEIDPRSMPPLAVYKLLIGCVVPRPIAWVSTVSAEGVHNLAPFSFFMGVCSDPPTIAFSASRRAPIPGRGSRARRTADRVAGALGPGLSPPECQTPTVHAVSLDAPARSC